jgi:hypothetical protein
MKIENVVETVIAAGFIVLSGYSLLMMILSRNIIDTVKFGILALASLISFWEILKN